MPVLIAGAIAALAWLQPVSTTDSDAGVALVAAQALIEHGTLDLDVYRHLSADSGRQLHYDLDADYRIERRRDGTRPYLGIGVPVLMAPVVALARLFGFDMLDPAHEAGLQNLLSAIACGLVYLLLFRLGRCFLPPAPSMLLAAVFQLASPLTSTLATALWNLDLSVPLMLIVLIALVRYEQGARPAPWLAVATILPLAVLSRPTAAFLGLGLSVYLLRKMGMTLRWIGVLGLAVTAFLVWLDSLPVVLAPVYYAPQRLLGITPLQDGLPAILLSPSRGLLVFCPFLLPLIVAIWRQRRFLADNKIALLCAIWGTTHILALATKGRWWGGHSFGPRMMTELLLPSFVLAAMLLARSFRGKRTLVAIGLALAFPSVVVHSGQGLFNDATRRWNEWPSIDQAPELLFSWRFPQFLASEQQLVDRALHWQRERLQPLVPEQAAGPRDATLLFEGWWAPEGTPDAPWRWSRAPEPRVCFRPTGYEAERWYVLRTDLGAFGRQDVSFGLRESELGRATIEGFEPSTWRWPMSGRVLQETSIEDSALRCLTLVPSHPRRAAAPDLRLVALSFRSLRLDPLPAQPAITWRDDAAFAHGWSVAETGLRWSDGRRARLLIATQELDGTGDHLLELIAFGAGEQTVHARLGDGTELGSVRVGPNAALYAWPLPASVIAEMDILVVELELPDARRPGTGDTRQLGIALEQARIVPSTVPSTQSAKPSATEP